MAAPMMNSKIMKIFTFSPRIQHLGKVLPHKMFSKVDINVPSRLFASRNVLPLLDRGLISGVFPENKNPDLMKHLCSSECCVYAGFDPTADSLHVGNLLVLIGLVHFQRAGHKTVTLVGGATGKIGDPCGRVSERQNIEDDVLEKNIVGIQKNINSIFENHENYIWRHQDVKLPANTLINNIDWYKNLNVIDFMSSVGRQSRMATMLKKESVQTRLKSPQGMSFTEFSYQLFQAFDWQQLYKNYNCTIQIGGNDQLGNIIAGYEFISTNKNQIYGMTVPLVTTSSGTKLGKSAGNALWLDPKKTSAFDFYQFFINIADSDVLKYLKLFTFLPDNEIDDVMKAQKENARNRSAQKLLAEQLTLLVHGQSGLKTAKLSTEILFKQSTEALFELSEMELTALFDSSPQVSLTLEAGITVEDLINSVKCFPRPEDAEKVIGEGGFYINQQKITNSKAVLIQGQHILPSGISVIRIGKKNNYHIVKWQKF